MDLVLNGGGCTIKGERHQKQKILGVDDNIIFFGACAQGYDRKGQTL